MWLLSLFLKIKYKNKYHINEKRNLIKGMTIIFMNINLKMNIFYPWCIRSCFNKKIVLTNEIKKNIKENLISDEINFDNTCFKKKRLQMSKVYDKVTTEYERYNTLIENFRENNQEEFCLPPLKGNELYSAPYRIFYMICQYTALEIHNQLKDMFFEGLSNEAYMYLFQQYYYEEISKTILQLVKVEPYFGYRLIYNSFGENMRRFEMNLQIMNSIQSDFYKLYKDVQNIILKDKKYTYLYLMSFCPSNQIKTQYYERKMLDNDLEMEKEFLSKAVLYIDEFLAEHKDKETNYHFLLLFRKQLSNEHLNKMLKRVSKLKDYDFLELVLHCFENLQNLSINNNLQNIDLKLIDKIRSKIVMNSLKN